MLSDGVHGGGNERYLELDVPCQVRRDIDISECERNMARHDNDVIICVSNATTILYKYLRCSVPVDRGEKAGVSLVFFRIPNLEYHSA